MKLKKQELPAPEKVPQAEDLRIYYLAGGLIHNLTSLYESLKYQKISKEEAEEECSKLLENFDSDLKRNKAEGANFELLVSESFGISSIGNVKAGAVFRSFRDFYEKELKGTKDEFIVKYFAKAAELFDKYDPNALKEKDYVNMIEIDLPNANSTLEYSGLRENLREIWIKIGHWRKDQRKLDIKIEVDGEIFEYSPILSIGHKINNVNYPLMLDIIKKLYTEGADINLQDENGNTILHQLAIKTNVKNHLVYFSFQLDSERVNFSPKDDDLEKPLGKPLIKNYPQVEKSKNIQKFKEFLKFVEEKMDMGLKNKLGYTAFEYAMMYNNEHVAEMIHDETNWRCSFEEAKSGFFSGEICNFHISGRIFENPLASLVDAFREGEL